MFGWRKKRDGFEWHEYVRTTILVRRANRRRKMEDARQAAVGGLKDAGAAALNGLADAKDGAAQAARGAAASAVSGAGAAGSVLAQIAIRSAAWIRSGLGKGAASVSYAATPLLDRIADRRINIIVGAIGVAAAAAAAYRTWHLGFDGRALLAFVVAGAAVALAIQAVRHARDTGRTQIAGRGGVSVGRRIVSRRLTEGLGWGVFAVIVVLGLGAALGPAKEPTAQSSPHKSSTTAANGLRGKAVAVSGGTLQIGRRLVHLAHIEAPERGQSCERGNGKSWTCGESARAALAKLVRNETVICDTASGDASTTADCHTSSGDLAAALVAGGHVFAAGGFLARHSSREAEARGKQLGLWAGQSLRPAEWRAVAWEEAKKSAPHGCPIKGGVTSAGKRYVMPWMQGYERIKVRTARGERWFCSEDEALAAGWLPSAPS